MKIIVTISLLFLLSIPNVVRSQINFSETNTIFLDSLLKSNPNLNKIREKANLYKLQIIYTQVDGDSLKPKIKNFAYNLSSDSYFYPASIVKLPVSVFTIEKLEKLMSFGVTLDSKLTIEKNFSCQTEVLMDKFSKNDFPTLRNYIFKGLIVSDNDSYNRLYEFVGHEYLNSRLSELGFSKSRIVSRFSNCSLAENRQTNGFKFYNFKDELLFYQKPASSSIPISPPLENMKLGKSYIKNGKYISSPRDFSNSNCLPLKDAHEMLVRLVYPNLFKESFVISNENRKFILKTLSDTPSECPINKIASNPSFHDFYTNYLYYGANKKSVKKDSLKIYNIVGLSYGFLTDIAYFEDSKNNIRFFLSAVLYANPSDVVGSDSYEYYQIGLPFLKDLGQCMYNYELSRLK